jgi:hypothetical protein
VKPASNAAIGAPSSTTTGRHRRFRHGKRRARRVGCSPRWTDPAELSRVRDACMSISWASSRTRNSSAVGRLCGLAHGRPNTHPYRSRRVAVGPGHPPEKSDPRNPGCFRDRRHVPAHPSSSNRQQSDASSVLAVKMPVDQVLAEGQKLAAGRSSPAGDVGVTQTTQAA